MNAELAHRLRLAASGEYGGGPDIRMLCGQAAGEVEADSRPFAESNTTSFAKNTAFSKRAIADAFMCAVFADDALMESERINEALSVVRKHFGR